MPRIILCSETGILIASCFTNRLLKCIYYVIITNARSVQSCLCDSGTEVDVQSPCIKMQLPSVGYQTHGLTALTCHCGPFL